MVSFITTSRALALSAALSSVSLTAATNLRAGADRNLILDNDGWLCSTFSVPLLCDESPNATEPAFQCPEVSPLNATEFDLDTFIAKSWYIQKQQTNPYQSADQLYCVVATYEKNSENATFLDVKNYGNNGAVNGPSQNSDDNGFFSNLCGRQVEGGELEVAPCLFGPVFEAIAGPYWVLALADDYTWAIVSGGQPDQPRQDPAKPNVPLCTTKEGDSFLDTNGSGLWLFTRDQVASAATIATMETTLESLGVYTGDLKPVTQQGCLYEGATLK